MAKNNDKEMRDDAHRQIIPVAADPDMVTWLEELFHLSPKDTAPVEGRAVPKTEPDSFPERISLRPIYGNRGIDKGPPIKNKEWKPMQSAVPSREHLVMLANEFLAAAQKECNVSQKRQRFALFAYSTLKAAEDYERYLFVLTPTAKEYGEKGGAMAPATDDEDTHRDRFLSTMLAHSRWEREQHNEAMSGIVKALLEDKQHQREEIMHLYAERRQLIITSEEALSKKEERETAREWARFKQQSIEEGIMVVKSLIPAFQIYLSKGKVGIVEGLKNFLQGLSPEQELKLLGRWENGECNQPGVLDGDQLKTILAIVKGQIDPKDISGVMATLRPEQIEGAREVLRPDQVQSLFVLAKAAGDTGGANGAS